MSETSAGNQAHAMTGTETHSVQLTELQQWAIRYKTVVAAGAGSSIAAFVGYPLDSIKTRMQGFPFRNVWHCTLHTYREEGIRGFFRGVSIPLVSITFIRTTSFSIYESSKIFYGKLLDHPLYSTPISTRYHPAPSYVTTPPYKGFFTVNAGTAFLSGCTAGAFISFLACPLEFAKVGTQIIGLIRTSSPGGALRVSPQPLPADPFAISPITAAKEVYQARGLRGLYTGFQFHFIRDTLGTGTYFMTYESIKYCLSGPTLSGPSTYAISGGLCGVISWCLFYPFDTAKVRAQKQAFSYPPGKMYHRITLWNYAWVSTNNYRGILVSVLRSALINAINFPLYEGIRMHISNWERQQGDAAAANESRSPNHKVLAK